MAMKRSYHSHLTRMLREARAAGAEAAARGMPIDEVTDLRRERRLNRREMLFATGSLVGVAMAGFPRPARAASQPRIVVVGSGLAGLRCAHKLWTERGLSSTVYEWDSHVGGRVQTLRGFFANGQIVEQHGEFISSEHASMLALASRFGLALDVANHYPPHTDDVYWFNGGYYTQAQLNADWKSFGWALFKNAVKQAPFPTSYNHYTAQGYAWDHLSVADWIKQNVPGGLASPFGGLCYHDVISEYGGPPEQQSALNLLYVLGYDDSAASGYQPKGSPVLAGTDEKYHVRGGNDQIITHLVGELPAGTIQLNHKLVALKDNGDKTYTCTFESGATTLDVVADHVVLALPFTTLRNVDLTKANLSPLKLQAIQNLQLGTNAKIVLQFKTRVWYARGFDGGTYADNGAAASWECTNYQAGQTGILIDYPGGLQGASLGTRYGLTTDNGTAPAAMVADTLTYLEPIFPGVTAAYNGKAFYDAGILDQHVGGAYSYYQVGQYTGFGGIQSQPEGAIHFAGEHTSSNFQGFMEGAVTSGERAAGEI